MFESGAMLVDGRSLIVGLLFASNAFAAAKEQRLQLGWDELAGVVQGKKVQMILRNGQEGLIGGGAGLAYLFGRSIDRNGFVISIVD